MFSHPHKPVEMGALRGMIEGGAVGEALGLPVVGRDAVDLRRSPITEMLGFGDGVTPGGSVSVCTNSAFDMAHFLLDNEVQGYTPQRFFQLINSWYLYKVQGEDDPLRIILPSAVVAGCVFSALPTFSIDLAVKSMPDLVCDSVIASASMFFGASLYLAHGHKPRVAISKAENLSQRICSEIGLIVGNSGSEAALCRLLDAFADCFGDGYPAVVLGAVNSGFMPDLAGCLVGSLAGFLSSGSNIPPRWKSLLRCTDELNYSSEHLYQLMKRVGEGKIGG